MKTLNANFKLLLFFLVLLVVGILSSYLLNTNLYISNNGTDKAKVTDESKVVSQVHFYSSKPIYAKPPEMSGSNSASNK